MVEFPSGITRCRRLPGRVSGLAIATGLLVAACAPAQTAATGAAASTATAHGAAKPSSSASQRPSSTADCTTTCYTPQQLEAAYGVQPLLRRGIDGRGETVVLPELAETQPNPPVVTDLRQDFAAYDRLYHLPAPRLKVVSTFPGPVHPWLAFGEEVLDAEVVHAIAPRAALTIVLVQGTSLDSAGQAVTASVAALRLGATEGGVISLSPAGQIGGEHCVDNAQLTQLNSALQADADHHVTVVAASGDTGAAGEPCALIDALGGSMSGFTPRKEVNLVTADPLVLSAGGTTLDASHTTGTWTGETAWGLPDGSPGGSFQASGGGFSHLFHRPSYQDGVQGIGSMRGIPDVAADGDSVTGIAVITSNTGGGYTLSGHAGTSASAPLWAGIIALADQYAQRHLGFVNPAIYQIARTSQYHQAFHDVTAGPSNTAEFPPTTITGYRAGPGWDAVTGWGSPDAQVLVPLLDRLATA
jgi:subtilase family serine protease